MKITKALLIICVVRSMVLLLFGVQPYISGQAVVGFGHNKFGNMFDITVNGFRAIF